MFCGKCGTQISDNENFCGSCGAVVNQHHQTSQNQTGIYNSSAAQPVIKNKLTGIIVCIVVLAFVVIGAIALLGGNKRGNAIAGIWADEQGTVWFELYEDGTCKTLSHPDAAYYEAAENGTITFSDMYHYPYDPVNYRIIGNKLYISEGDIDYDIENNSKLARRKSYVL